MQSNIMYTDNYYKKLRIGSRKSAREIVPLVLELIQPQSVIDVGCGAGTWLSVFKEHGIEDYLGVDGNWVDKKMLEIPEEQFLSFDLTNPFEMDRQFDLVISLEVAEHLPSECAEIFVDSLVRLGPVILFSAAIPFQGGRQHINEQWPDHWVKLFKKEGYTVIDCIRSRIWQNEKVEWWYAQNILIFVQQNYLGHHPELRNTAEKTHTSQLSIVHPKMYLESIRFAIMMQDIGELIPKGDTFIMVDQEEFRTDVTAMSGGIPFLERNGQYWGLPPDNRTAIHELERLRKSGANFIVFAWPAFWWLDYYTGLNRYLTSKFKCILKNDRLVIFDLRV